MKGHSGVTGNEETDKRAKSMAWIGKRMLKPSIAMPTGIRQAFPVHCKPGKARRRLGGQRADVLVIDRGYQRASLH